MRSNLGFNKGHHYILIIINVLSKYAWAISLKNKSGSETADAIAEIVRESGKCLKNLQMDIGKEFYNATAIISESTSCRIWCQTTRASIALSACDLSM